MWVYINLSNILQEISIYMSGISAANVLKWEHAPTAPFYKTVGSSLNDIAKCLLTSLVISFNFSLKLIKLVQITDHLY